MIDAAFDPAIAAVFRTAKEYGGGLGGVNDVNEWPWDWVDLATTLRAIENAYERALIAKAKLPPREVVFSKKRLEDWIEMHKDQDD